MGTQDKVQFNHARDNAISALAKVIKNQYNFINVEETFAFWLSKIPLEFDLTEAKL